MQVTLALDWMNHHGRSVDQRCVSVELGELVTSAIAQELMAFRNPDGGFGRTLEPDVRLAGSSVLATTIALQLLARYDPDGASSLLEGASRFLVGTYDDETAAWPIVPANVSDSPHAPWWVYRPPADCLVNPRAGLLGYAYRWPGFVADVDVDRMTTEVREHVMRTDRFEMHELLVLNRLFTSPYLPPALDDLRDRFLELALRAIPADVDEWRGYSLTPLTIVDDPAHPLAGELSGPIAENIEYLQSLQAADGSWDPPWDWGSGHGRDEAWREVENDVRSVITARAICTLHRFGAL